jgi:hypothetical protein
VSKTLYRNPIWSESKGQAETNFVAVIPSPTGKWLLFQQSIWSCGSADNTYVMAAKGGPATGALSSEFSHTYALGWLGGHTALVGGDRTGECGGATSGLYVVDARYPSINVPQLVGADADIASTWGFGN